MSRRRDAQDVLPMTDHGMAYQFFESGMTPSDEFDSIEGDPLASTDPIHFQQVVNRSGEHDIGELSVDPTDELIDLIQKGESMTDFPPLKSRSLL